MILFDRLRPTPRAGLEPARERGGYKTVGSGPRSRMWRPPSIGPNVVLDGAAATLRAQSRHLARSNALAMSAIERLTSNIVGTGIKPQIEDAALASLWYAWTDEADAAGVQDLYGLQAQIARAVVEAGECFIRFRVRRPEDGLTVPLQLEVVEPELVPMEKNEVRPNGNIVRQGIEFDRSIRSRRVAYWMHRAHPGEQLQGQIGDYGLPVRVPASEVAHVFLPGRPGQIRGEPWLARVLSRLRDVDAYEDAELVRKKVAALYAGFVRRPVPDGMTPDEVTEFWGAADDDPDGVARVALEPGTMHILEPGEEVEFSSPADVGAQYEPFLRQQVRAIAAGLGLLYEQLAGDYSQVNDRTWRAAVSEFRRRCELWQHNLIVFQFCRPVWGKWGALAYLSGAARSEPPRSVVWTPQAWPYINPVQDIQATRDAIAAGLTSRQKAVSERGEDATQIDEENAEDMKRAEGLGLIYTSDPRERPRVGPGRPPEPPEDPT